MSKRAGSDTSPAPQETSSTGLSSILTPTPSASNTSSRDTSVPTKSFRDIYTHDDMDEQSKLQTGHKENDETGPIASTGQDTSHDDAKPPPNLKKTKCAKPEEHKKSKKSGEMKKKAQKSRKVSKLESSTDSSSEEDDVSDSTDSEAESSEGDKKAKKRKAIKQKAAKKSKEKKRRQSKNVESDNCKSSDSENESESGDSSSEDDPPKRRKKSSKKVKKTAQSDSEDDDDAVSDSGATLGDIRAQLEALKLQISGTKRGRKNRTKHGASSQKASKSKRKSSKKGKEGSLGFKRVDELWDSNTHNYRLKESAEDDDGEFAECAFLVRRTFDWENKFTGVIVDIKAKQLRAVLLEVLKDCKSTTLEAEEPSVDPKTLFLYLEELRTYYRKALQDKIKAEKKRKIIKTLKTQRSLCKTLVAYLDEDYAETNRTLKPLLAAGNITFELLWALFKPNEIAISSCYGSWEEPRCFKVDFSHRFSSLSRGEWYCVEGKYMEYDGKNFGLGDFEVDVEGFKGPRKITSLACYPLIYHPDVEGVKKQIIERGKKFVQLEGMNYRFHKGLAFMKKKKVVAKINIKSRIMIDPGTFRRINPNYPISLIKPHEADGLMSDEADEDSDCSCYRSNSDNGSAYGGTKKLQQFDANAEPQKQKWKIEKNADGNYERVWVDVDENGNPIRRNTVDQLETKRTSTARIFTDEELLLTSPVVLGFAFNEKLWLEFSFSGVRDIEYNADAFDSLVLPSNQKSIVRALVESHKFHAARTIDDVVQGNGKGLVAVLHGPPGTGKTLTAEGISELLRCPLYAVSAGELGTDPARLETELQKILDIAHSWGAVLLLDEADVFLEKREVHDIHRNALVSIFLRLLEYFQGILFLTTNRVETFDDAFASRIHVALRYGELTGKAKKSVWKMFIDLCRAQPGSDGLIGSGVGEISDRDLEMLSRAQLNGRQIKNIVRTAQALALNEGSLLDLTQIKRVMDVAESFDRDLKGGTGYLDAMRSYT